jgi:TolA-binding protein
MTATRRLAPAGAGAPPPGRTGPRSGRVPCGGLVAGLLALACAAPRGAAPTPARANEVTFPPEELVATSLDVELAGKNDEELFAVGIAAFGAGEFSRAAAAFARVADVFPASRHVPAALYNAGLSYERTAQWALGLERFRALEKGWEGPDAVEASFRVAECLYHMDELGPAREKLDAIAGRPGLPSGERVRALAQRGVVELEMGKGEQAEATLRSALATWETASADERLDEYWAAQAQYYLGEVYREWFRALPLDPSSGDEGELVRQLEQKAEMLLSTQGHYLRAIRLGNDAWAVASGFRIGELYDGLRAQMLEAPLPPGLSEEESGAYRAELRRKVRVLATKAITAYEQTLRRATRSRVDDLRFLADAQASLERLKKVLADDAREGAM